jgi:phage tail-like protein
MFPFKGPSGRVDVPDVTLDRGVTGSTDAYTWFLQVADIAAQIGVKDRDYTRTVHVVQLDLDGEELFRWTLFGAWPMKFKAGDWDNTSDDVVIEQLVLCYDYPVRA